MSLLYLAYIGVFSLLVPSAAPKLASTEDPLTGREVTQILVRGILPPVALISMVLGSILTGFVTITESAAVGAGGAMLLAVIRRKLDFKILRDCLQRSAMMIGMIFFLYIGATCFSYVFLVLGGDEVILTFVNESGLSSWGVLVVAIMMIFVMGFFFAVLEILLIVVQVFDRLITKIDFWIF